MRRTFLLLIICTLIIAPMYSQPDTSSINILVFTKTNGYRHAVTSEAVKTLMDIGEANHWELTFTEDTSLFTESFLQHFDVLVFMLALGDIFDEMQKIAFQQFIHSGKGFVGIHTGTIVEMEWPWYVDLIGTTFVGHPPEQEGKLIIEDRTHPATSFFATNEWVCTDEWYSFTSNPRANVHVLMSIDESSYDVDNNEWFPGAVQRMGDHPLVWYQEFEGSRIFQTALGHTPEMYADTLFQNHLVGAINWAGFREDILK